MVGGDENSEENGNGTIYYYGLNCVSPKFESYPLMPHMVFVFGGRVLKEVINVK